MFTTADYEAWPDSWEQARINRLRREAAGRQLSFDFETPDYDPEHCACETRLSMCKRCLARLEARQAA